MILAPAVRLVNVGDATPTLLKINVFFVALYNCTSPFTVNAPEVDDNVFDDVPNVVVFVIFINPEEIVGPETFKLPPIVVPPRAVPPSTVKPLFKIVVGAVILTSPVPVC